MLIGPLEGVGAAIASLAGPLMGFVVAASYYRGCEWRGFVPTVRDGVYAVGAAHDLLAGMVRRAARRP